MIPGAAQQPMAQSVQYYPMGDGAFSAAQYLTSTIGTAQEGHAVFGGVANRGLQPVCFYFFFHEIHCLLLSVVDGRSDILLRAAVFNERANLLFIIAYCWSSYCRSEIKEMRFVQVV